MSACHSSLVPSPWVERFAGFIPKGGLVLDVACGRGRHSRLLADLGLRVIAVDRDRDAIASVAAIAGVQATVADLEAGPWPFHELRFDGIVVVNYLHRPLLPVLRQSLAPGGVLIYETFARGNERYGRPSNPAFLLLPGELLRFAEGLRIIAYEDLYVETPGPALVQRICAINAKQVPGW